MCPNADISSKNISQENYLQGFLKMILYKYNLVLKLHRFSLPVEIKFVNSIFGSIRLTLNQVLVWIFHSFRSSQRFMLINGAIDIVNRCVQEISFLQVSLGMVPRNEDSNSMLAGKFLIY